MNPTYYIDNNPSGDKVDNDDGIEYVKVWDCSGISEEIKEEKCDCIHLFGCNCK